MNTCRNSKTPFFTGWVCLRERSICKPRQEPTPNYWGGETGRLMGVGTPAVTNQHYVHQRPAPALCVQAVSRKPKSPNTDFLSSQMIKTNESTKTRRNTPDTGRSLSEVKLAGTFLWRVYMFSFCLHGFSLDVLVFPHNPKTCPESSSELNCGVLQYLRWSTEASRDLQFTGLNSIWWVGHS